MLPTPGYTKQVTKKTRMIHSQLHPIPPRVQGYPPRLSANTFSNKTYFQASPATRLPPNVATTPSSECLVGLGRGVREADPLAVKRIDEPVRHP